MTEEDGTTDGPADGQEIELPSGIRALAREINNPPATPREEIWARIRAERADKAENAGVTPITVRRSDAQTVRQSDRQLRRFTVWAAGIAAILVLGFVLGRGSVTNTPGSGPSLLSALPDSTIAPGKKNLAYTMATVQHLTRVETFLTSMRTAPGQKFNGQARDLLTSTRLLLDAKDIDPRLRKLLADLEDILVQIVQYDASGSREDLDLITDGLEERQVMPRLQNAIPAGPARTL